jgi:hypothetical protein
MSTRKAGKSRIGCWLIPPVLLAGLIAWRWFVEEQYNPGRLPTVAMPQPNAFDSFVEAARSVASDTQGTDGLKHMEVSEATEVVKANADPLQTFHSAIGKPCQYPVGEHLPLNVDQINLAQLVVVEGRCAEAKRNWRRAALCYLDVFEFGTMVEKNARIGNGLVGTLVVAMAERPLDSLLDRCDGPTVDYVAGRLTALTPKLASFAEMLRFEPAYERASLMQEVAISAGPVEASGLRAYFSLNRRQVFEAHDRYDNALIAWYSGPYYQRGPLPPEPTGLKRYFIGNLRLYRAADQDVTAKHAKTQLLVIKAALRSYRMRHGDYPASLADLHLDPAILADPFRNAPMVYRRTPHPTGKTKPYVLYSVGKTCTDRGELNGITTNSVS